MPSVDPIPTTLSDQLRHVGLVHTAADLNDLIARATQKRWSPVVLLEQLAQAELTARLHQRVERRLHDARLGRYKALADFEWTWPTQLPNWQSANRLATAGDWWIEDAKRLARLPASQPLCISRLSVSIDRRRWCLSAAVSRRPDQRTWSPISNHTQSDRPDAGHVMPGNAPAAQRTDQQLFAYLHPVRRL